MLKIPYTTTQNTLGANPVPATGLIPDKEILRDDLNNVLTDNVGNVLYVPKDV